MTDWVSLDTAIWLQTVIRAGGPSAVYAREVQSVLRRLGVLPITEASDA